MKKQQQNTCSISASLDTDLCVHSYSLVSLRLRVSPNDQQTYRLFNNAYCVFSRHVSSFLSCASTFMVLKLCDFDFNCSLHDCKHTLLIFVLNTSTSNQMKISIQRMKKLEIKINL